MEAPDVSSVEFKQDMEEEVLSGWRDENHVETLVNGEEYFPAMLEAINSAEETITFETFVVVNAFVTYDLVMALRKKAMEGVKVHFIIDGIGSKRLDERYLIAMEDGGVDVQIYRPMNYLTFWRCNNRDHRKLLVVDGEVGFTGGAGYADCWDGGACEDWRWRDTMYKLEGPVVADLQHAFADNWKEITGQDLSGESYFPPLKKAGKMKAQGVLGAPEERGDTLGASYLLAIDSAKESILIEHAYFIPNKQLRESLLRARARGVEIDIILPNETIDSKVVRLTSKTYWREMMDAGIRSYEYDACMLHGKLMEVDDTLSIIGSGNFDDRTFFINDEFNVNVLCKHFAAEQREMFERDLTKSKRMGYDDVEVSWSEKPKQWVGKIIEPQL
jgi:cardiolipin synthase